MKKLTMIAALVVMGALMYGCTTVYGRNYKTGAYAGMAAYNGYTRIMEKLPDDNPNKAKLRVCVEKLWTIIDSLEVSNAVQTATLMRTTSEEMYQTLKTDKSEIATRNLFILASIYRTYGNQITIIEKADTDKKREDAVKWLISFREGVNLMYSLDTGSIFAPKNAKDSDSMDYKIVTVIGDKTVVPITDRIDKIEKIEEEE